MEMMGSWYEGRRRRGGGRRKEEGRGGEKRKRETDGEERWWWRGCIEVVVGGLRKGEGSETGILGSKTLLT